MKTRILSLVLAGAMGVQNIAGAQSSRVGSIGEQQIASSLREIQIIRRDLTRLDQALVEVDTAIRERQKSGNLASIHSVSAATAGLAIAALALTITKFDGKTGTIIGITAASMLAMKTGIASALGLVAELQKKGGRTEPANKALIKARQEILAARAAAGNDKAAVLLMDLDKSLESIQVTLNDYKNRENLNKRLHITGLISEAAGTAMTFYLGFGIFSKFGLGRTGALVGPLLMASGNIAVLINTLSPSKANEVLAEIAKTREAIARASTVLN
jgi:hypothetical protein